jgi:hypothetical protein
VRWGRLTSMLLLSAVAGVIADAQIDRARFDRARALERAFILARGVCQRECAKRGGNAAQIKAPAESPINADPGSSQFEFEWVLGRERLAVAVFDNGLYIDAEYWWRPKDSVRR